jgi:uncharacterized sulfatase
MQKPGDDTTLGGSSTHLGRTTLAPVYEFLDAHVARPFLVWFAPMLPHVPHDAGAAYRRPYEGGELSADALAYYANITRFDAVVAEVMAYLDEKGLRERTLVVYLSDNGWDQAPDRTHPSVMAGLKGKHAMYELGFRTPIIFNWPGRVPAGTVHADLVSTVDLLPTLLDYAGIELPAGLPGHSLRPLIEGSDNWARDTVIGNMRQWRVPKPPGDTSGGAHMVSGDAFFLRTPKWRYIWFADQGMEELYDMESDPEENRDVAQEHPILAAMFRARIVAWQAEMKAGAPDGVR